MNGKKVYLSFSYAATKESCEVTEKFFKDSGWTIEKWIPCSIFKQSDVDQCDLLVIVSPSVGRYNVGMGQYRIVENYLKTQKPILLLRYYNEYKIEFKPISGILHTGLDSKIDWVTLRANVWSNPREYFDLLYSNTLNEGCKNVHRDYDSFNSHGEFLGFDSGKQIKPYLACINYL